jgi:hypothetical protein
MSLVSGLTRLALLALLAMLPACGKSESSKSKSSSSAEKEKGKAEAAAKPAEEPIKLEPFWSDPAYVKITDQGPCPEGLWALLGADPPGETPEEKKASLARKADLKKSLEGTTFLVHMQGPSEVNQGEYANAKGEFGIDVKSTVICKAPVLGTVTIALGPGVSPQLPEGRDFGQYYWLGPPARFGVPMSFGQANDFRAKHKFDLDARLVFKAGKSEHHKKLIRSTETAEEAAERKKHNIPKMSGGMDDWGAGWVMRAQLLGVRVASERGRTELATIRPVK